MEYVKKYPTFLKKYLNFKGNNPRILRIKNAKFLGYYLCLSKRI